MAVRGLGREETCIIHYNRPAAARCGMCHKPVCSECVTSTADGKFCSHECARKAADYRKNAARIKAPSQAGRKAVRLVIWILVIVVALAALNKYALKNDMPVLGPYLNKLPFLGK